jgi:hypothetical protein
MSQRRDLAIDALSRALKLRKQLEVPLSHSLSAIDAAERLGIEVRFIDLPSMEGIYVAGKEPQILLSSLRPQGRQMFTCAHEIGHHIYGHGDRFDAVRPKTYMPKNEQEFLADCFAAYFLMPKATIDAGMRARGLTYDGLTPLSVYSLSSWLGTGYQTLVTHLRLGLRLITKAKADELAEAEARAIRGQLSKHAPSKQLHTIDAHWVGRAIDCDVNDLLLVPENCIAENDRLKRHTESLMRAVAPGIDRLWLNDRQWSAFVRVSPQNYVGRSCFRFEEACE